MSGYKINVSMELAGPYLAQLNVAHRHFENLNREAATLQRTMNGLRLPYSFGDSIQRAYARMSSLKRLADSLAGMKIGNQAGMSAWAQTFGASTREAGALAGVMGRIDSSVASASRHIQGWAKSFDAAARAAGRIEAAVARSGAQPTPIVQSGRRVHTSGSVGREGSAVANIIGIHTGAQTLGSIARAGMSAVREDLLAKNQGRTPEENAALQALASRMSQLHPSLSRLSIREQGRLLVPNVGTFEKALELLPEYLKAQVAVQTVRGPAGAQKDMETFARAIDVIGRSTSVEDTRGLLESYVRTLQLDPGAVKANDYLNAAQATAAAGKGLSVPFWSSVMPALFMQQGGARTGTDLASAFQNTVIGRGTNESLLAQSKYGFRTGLVTKVGRGGKTSVVDKGSLIDEELYMSHPYEWAKKHAVPEMVSRGMMPKSYLTGDFSQSLTETQRSAGTKFLSENFSNRRGANVFSIMLQDLSQMEKIFQSLAGTRGFADLLSDQLKDPFVAMEALAASANNVASALSSPAIPELVGHINRLNTSLGSLATTLERNPVLAQGLFAGGAGLVGGLATAGAAALTVAAVSTLSLPALAIGSIAALTIGSFLMPWDRITPHLFGNGAPNSGLKLSDAAREALAARATKDAPLGWLKSGFDGAVEGMRRFSSSLDALSANEWVVKWEESKTKFYSGVADFVSQLGPHAEKLAAEIQSWPGRVADAISGMGAAIIAKIKEALGGLLNGFGSPGNNGGAVFGGTSFNGSNGLGGLIHKASLGGANDNFGGLGSRLGGGSGSYPAAGDGTFHPMAGANGSLPAGMRNNNPGNIKWFGGAATRFPGALGPSANTDQGDPQIRFSTADDGMRAAASLLLRKFDQGRNTINAIVAARGGWTPGNTGAAANIARLAGVGPNDAVNLRDPATLSRVLRGLVTQEHGPKSRLYNDQMIANAAGTVLGLFGGDTGGLRIKGGPGGQAFGGGPTHPGVLEAAKAIQALGGVNRFTGFNDRHHAGGRSMHARGLAADVTGNAAAIMAGARKAMGEAGLLEGRDYRLLNEYARPSRRSTGGHVHFEFRNREAAEAYARSRAMTAKPPPVAKPPPKRQQEDPIVTNVHLDGKVLTRVVTQRLAAGARYPRHVGGMDTHGTHRPPGTTTTDAA